jgi:peptidoglycan hydrolase-like protein with peptidoglycan-binding domain
MRFQFSLPLSTQEIYKELKKYELQIRGRWNAEICLPQSQGSKSSQTVIYGREFRGTLKQKMTVLARTSGNLAVRQSSACHLLSRWFLV